MTSIKKSFDFMFFDFIWFSIDSIDFQVIS